MSCSLYLSFKLDFGLVVCISLSTSLSLCFERVSLQGEKCCDVVESSGKVRVSCEQLGPEEALQGQQTVLKEMCAKAGWEDTAALMQQPWVGTLPLPGTAQMSKRRTHAFVVSKGVLDEELAPCMTSMLADRSANHSAKALIDTFDYGVNRKCTNQERLGVVSSDASTARASVQQRLMESTNGMFHVEMERQVEMAQELAEGRDRQADIAFKEWAKSKVIQKKKDEIAARKVERQQVDKQAVKEKENKHAFKQWATARKKKKYMSKEGKKLKDWPIKNKPLVQRPWSFAPPVYEEEFI